MHGHMNVKYASAVPDINRETHASLRREGPADAQYFIFILEQQSTCFGRSFRPSSGV